MANKATSSHFRCLRKQWNMAKCMGPALLLALWPFRWFGEWINGWKIPLLPNPSSLPPTKINFLITNLLQLVSWWFRLSLLLWCYYPIWVVVCNTTAPFPIQLQLVYLEKEKRAQSLGRKIKKEILENLQAPGFWIRMEPAVGGWGHWAMYHQMQHLSLCLTFSLSKSLK